MADAGAGLPPPPGPPGGPAHVQHVFPAGTAPVRRTLRALRDWLDERPAAGTDPALAELVLAEVLNNVVEHACAEAPGRIVAVELWSGTAGLHCRVTDDGRPMPGTRPPANPLPEPHSLPEGGFGWPLIHQLTEDLHYSRARGVNVLSFRVRARVGAPLG